MQTQGPLSNTVKEFWRAIAQEKVGMIVAVGPQKEGVAVKFAKYWPENGKEA